MLRVWVGLRVGVRVRLRFVVSVMVRVGVWVRVTAWIWVIGQLSQLFETTSGVHRGCILAPALFCIAIDWMPSRCAHSIGTFVVAS